MDNEKKMLIAIVACVSLVAVVGIGLFTIQFAQHGLSPSTSDWANFGSFVGGILGPLLSLLTIFYMVWSFKKQTALVQEQLKQDKRKDECSMLMNELKVQIAKIETAFSQDAELSDVADRYFYYLHGKEKEFKRINSRTIEVEGEVYSASVFPLLVTLKVQAGEEAFKAFVHEVKGSVFYHPVNQARASLQIVAPLLLEAIEKGMSNAVTRSFVARCLPIARTLYDWEELTVWYYTVFASLQLLPTNVIKTKEVITSSLLSSLNAQQHKEWEHSEVEINIKGEGEDLECSIVHTLLQEDWSLDYTEEWKKAS